MPIRRQSPGESKPRAAKSLTSLRLESRDCRRCDLWKHATQTVFGAGPAAAEVMFVGEQPGDVEDRAGEPFVGPAGQLLRASLAEAGFDPDGVYLTNAVKHFKWTPRGKRRIHERPRHDEILACRYWLDREIERLKPRAIVALGATAAGVVLGSSARVMRDRTKLFDSPLAEIVTLTVHPSSILRTDPEDRQRAREQFVADLRTIAGLIRRRSRAG